MSHFFNRAFAGFMGGIVASVIVVVAVLVLDIGRPESKGPICKPQPNGGMPIIDGVAGSGTLLVDSHNCAMFLEPATNELHKTPVSSKQCLRQGGIRGGMPIIDLKVASGELKVNPLDGCPVYQ